MILVILVLLLSFIGVTLTFRVYMHTLNRKLYDAELLLYYLEQHFSILGKVEKLTMQQNHADALEVYHDLKKALVSAETKLKDKDIVFYYRHLYGLWSPD